MESENKLIPKFILHVSIYVIPEVMAKNEPVSEGMERSEEEVSRDLGAMKW